MAKRTTTKSRTAPKKSTVESSDYGFKNQNGFFKELISNPAVKYVAGGIATAMLSKFVTRLSEKYPEITRLLTDNLDSIENRLAEFRNSNSEENTSVSSH